MPAGRAGRFCLLRGRGRQNHSRYGAEPALMTTSDQDDNLPISMLNQLEYCERRFYLMHVLGEMEINVHVLEGTLQHEQAHQASADRKGDQITHRRIFVWSEALGIAGFADIV